MKNTKLRKLLKLGIVLYGLSLTLWNCENEFEHPTQQESRIDGQYLTLKDLKKQNPESALKVKQFLNKQSSQKTDESGIGNLTLATERILELKTDKFTSYTVQAFKNDASDKNKVHNYILTSYTNGNFTQYLLSYPILKGNQLDFRNIEKTIITSDILLQRNVECGPHLVSYEMMNNCVYTRCTEGGGHYWSQRRDCKGVEIGTGPTRTCDTTIVIEQQTTCGGGGSTDPNDGEGGDITLGSGGNNSSGGDDSTDNNNDLTDNTTITLPVLELKPQYYPLDVLNEKFSDKSPFEVDFTQIKDSISLPSTDSSKEANERLICLYDKLTRSNSFKNIFTNIFGGEQGTLNTKFKVTKDLKNDNGDRRLNGKRTVIPEESIINNGVITKLGVLIEIDEKLLNEDTNFEGIKTILHECIHAYLTLKKYKCTSWVSFNDYNNDDICETINTFYENFSCNDNQSQHEFMFDYMLPVFKTVYEEIGKLNFMTQGNINGLSDGYDLNYLHNPSVPNGINIPNSHTFNWDEFYLYNTLPGLHNTKVFETEIENKPEKKELYRAYKYLGNKFLKKECN